ncbi:MAG: trigger factor [Coriobacteriales bacterium]|nr:trigger factor [Coriobacteriales bacterium]
MNITVTTEKPENGQLVATLTISKKDVDAAVAKTYKEIARKYAFQGFRRGRAPRPVIDGIVGRQAVLADATNSLLNEAEPLMIEQLDVVPLGQINYGENPALVAEKSDYTIEAKIAVRPDVELDTYDAPTIKMPPEEVTEAEIDQQIEVLLSYRTTFEDVEEDRGAEDGDIVVANVENVSNLREYEGTNRMFALDDERLQQEWRDGLRGMKKDEEKEISWTRSHTHDDETHEATMAAKVTVVALRRSVTPELNEENVKDDFGFETIDELREAVKEEVAHDKSTTLPQLKEDRLVEAVGEHLTLEEIPAAYTEQIFNEIANQFLSQLQGQGMSLDMYLKSRGATPDDFVNDLRSQADERARQSLALDALAAHLGVEVSEDDVVAEFENAGVPNVKSSIDEFRRDGRLPAVRESIRRTKALEWLVENAQVEIVDEVAERRAAAAAEQE